MNNSSNSSIPGVFVYGVKLISSADGNFAKPFINDFVKGFYEDGFGEVYTIIFPPESKRGGHYHKNSTEFFCVIQGVAKLHLSSGDLRQEIEMNGQYPTTIQIPPGVTHLIENIGQENVVLIAYWNKSYRDDDNDTYQLS
jgi:dTDP-4-dehydrorhamnose 3,5-epimerase-like enzyme